MKIKHNKESRIAAPCLFLGRGSGMMHLSHGSHPMWVYHNYITGYVFSIVVCFLC